MESIYKEFLFCQNVEEWKGLFCDFLNEDINIIEFEKKIYSRKEFETKLGDLYIELISLDYRNSWSVHDVGEIVRKFVTDEDCMNWKLCKTFKSAGWEPRKIIYSEESGLIDVLTNLYGGLTVGDEGKQKMIIFESPEKADLTESWRYKIGQYVKAVGMADHGEIILFMDNNANFYIYMPSVEEIYFGGRFNEVMTKLLFGPDYGERIR